MSGAVPVLPLYILMAWAGRSFMCCNQDVNNGWFLLCWEKPSAVPFLGYRES
jgi:hypothetical protein